MAKGHVLVNSILIFGKQYIPEDGGVEITPGGIVKEAVGYQTDGSPIFKEMIKGSELKLTIAHDSSFDYNSAILNGQSGIVQIIYSNGQIKTVKDCAVNSVDESNDGKLTISLPGNAFIDNLTA